MLEELGKLPPAERAKRYRALADEADRAAAAASPAVKQSYVIMAEQWRKLADDLER